MTDNNVLIRKAIHRYCVNNELLVADFLRGRGVSADGKPKNLHRCILCFILYFDYRFKKIEIAEFLGGHHSTIIYNIEMARDYSIFYINEYNKIKENLSIILEEVFNEERNV